jgi:MFS family permease
MTGIIGAENRFGRDFNNPDPGMQGNITAAMCLEKNPHTRCTDTVMIVGAAILTNSTTIAQLIVGRTVTGIVNSKNSSTSPVYLTECAPASYRGALLTL